MSVHKNPTFTPIGESPIAQCLIIRRGSLEVERKAYKP